MPIKDIHIISIFIESLSTPYLSFQLPHITQAYQLPKRNICYGSVYDQINELTSVTRSGELKRSYNKTSSIKSIRPVDKRDHVECIMGKPNENKGTAESIRRKEEIE